MFCGRSALAHSLASTLTDSLAQVSMDGGVRTHWVWFWYSRSRAVNWRLRLTKSAGELRRAAPCQYLGHLACCCFIDTLYAYVKWKLWREKNRQKLRTQNAKYSGSAIALSEKTTYGGRTPIYLHRICITRTLDVVTFNSYVRSLRASFFFFVTFFALTTVWIAFADNIFRSHSFHCTHSLHRFAGYFLVKFHFGYSLGAMWLRGTRSMCSVCRSIGRVEEQDYNVRYNLKSIYYCMFCVVFVYYKRHNIQPKHIGAFIRRVLCATNRYMKCVIFIRKHSSSDKIGFGAMSEERSLLLQKLNRNSYSHTGKWVNI